jgi:hypothetical protein
MKGAAFADASDGVGRIVVGTRFGPAQALNTTAIRQGHIHPFIVLLLVQAQSSTAVAHRRNKQ